MKIKQIIWLSTPKTALEFLRLGAEPEIFADFFNTARPGLDMGQHGWMKIAEVEVELPSEEELLRAALAQLDVGEKATRAEYETKLANIANQRKELLALTHQQEGEGE